MSEAFTRFRDRITPCPGGTQTNLKWGKYFIEYPSPNQWIHLNMDITGGSGWPFLKAETCADQLHKGPPYKTGGPFRKIKYEYLAPTNGLFGTGTYISNFQTTLLGYRGRVKYVGAVAGFPSGWGGSSNSLSGIGSILNGSQVANTTALDSQVWDKLKPKIEQGGLFVAFAEVRDVHHMLHSTSKGFHDIWKAMGGSGVTKAMQPKKLAEHFVNHNFGWVPFVKDVYAMCDNVINSDTKIARLTRDNGNWTRRRAILVNQVSTSAVSQADGSLCWPSSTYLFDDFMAIDSTGHYMKRHWTNSEETWTVANAVGSFRYYVPEFDSSLPDYSGVLNTVKRQIDIHGARISPSNIYKAVPWSWLVDWVTITGKSIQDTQDAMLDNMAARYLFLMHHQVKTQKLQQLLPFNAISGGPKTLEFTRIIEVKQRKEADSPFGFGLSWEELSPKQLAILGALGILKLR